MKRKHIIALAVVLFCAAGAAAQSTLPDSTVTADTTVAADTAENVIGGRVAQSKRVKEANVIGMPVYYDTLGNVISGGTPSPSGGIYHRPKHHYLNNLGDHYCAFFAEMEMMMGTKDAAIGANFTYLPDRWGAYASVMSGFHNTHVTVGPALRLSGYESRVDWQLYGGLLFAGRHIGGEAGLRVAMPQHGNDFCWMSASMGMAVYNGDSYLTVGLSVEAAALSLLYLFLF